MEIFRDFKTTVEVITALLLAITSVLLVATSYINTMSNKKLLDETVKLRKVSTEPCVAVYFEPKERNQQIYEMVVKNIGNGPAKDINFIFTPDDSILMSGRNKFSDYPFLNKYEYLAPNQEIRFFFGTTFYFYNIENLKPISVLVEYKNRDNQQLQDVYNIDLMQLKNKPFINEASTKDIVKYLKEISGRLNALKS